ncbi:hypothetical protein BC939DRAFT_470166 [Gamsiella multidivaricata]|uniref:uncharacterized protein n=1 Tax=Gamsiella multidivaricata TaxID=101098 RepID=UPI00221F1FCD|nr:uncharacterized protein BC939DRAFT_470166 [Gamsiella multidivaricata]KAI7816147.1 hypothetical protein BC939DRAFT_470166 [Gamsiella multidivaricata]
MSPNRHPSILANDNTCWLWGTNSDLQQRKLRKEKGTKYYYSSSHGQQTQDTMAKDADAIVVFHTGK